MTHVVFIPFLVFCFSVLVFAQKAPVGATVQTSSGSITGHAALNRSEVSEYLGIPYAKPPLGDLRFAAPQSYSSSKPFDAASYVCSGPSTLLTMIWLTICRCSHRMSIQRWALHITDEDAVTALKMDSRLPQSNIRIRHRNSTASSMPLEGDEATHKARIA